MRLPVRLMSLAAAGAAAGLLGTAPAAALDMRFGDSEFSADRIIISGKAAPDGRSLTIDGRAEGVAVPDHATGITVETRLDVGISGGALTLGPDSRLRAAAEALGPTLARWLPARVLRLQAAEPGMPVVRLSGEGGTRFADLNLIALAGAGPGAPSIAVTGRVAMPPDGDAVALRGEDLRVTARSLPPAGGVRIDGPARLTLTRAAIRHSPAGTRVEAEAGAVDVALLTDAGRVEATADGMSLTATGGETSTLAFALADPAVRMAAMELAAEGFEARLSETVDGSVGGTLSLRRLRDLADTPWLAPFDIGAEVAGTREILVLDGHAGASGAEPVLPWRLRIAPPSADGTGSIGPATLVFGAGGIDPAAISPRLAELAAPEGTMTLEAGMTLADGAVESEGRLGLQGLTVRTAVAAVEGLHGTVAFGSLLPPVTAGVQEVTAERVVAVVPFEDARLRFRILDTPDGPTIEVASARASFAGATLSSVDARFDLSSGHGEAVVALDGLALPRLFETLALEDFSGTGTLDGSMPVTIGADGIRVGRGSIAATGPGLLNVGFGPARETLMAQGEYVQMMVRALEDFHYDTLSVSALRPAEGDLAMDVTLTGSNPQVLDGHPFRFNISLKGDIDPIVDALSQGRRLTGDLLRGTLERQP